MQTTGRQRLQDLFSSIRTLQGRVSPLHSRPEIAPPSAREALLIEAEKVTHLGSWIWDVGTENFRWSDELFRILGRDPRRDRASPDEFFAAIHPDDVGRVRAQLQESLRTRTLERLDFRVRRGDGSIREVVMVGAFLPDSRGGGTRLVGGCLDVTERRRSELKATRAQATLEMMEQLSGVGVFRYAPKEDEVYWSEEMHRIFGATAPRSNSLLEGVIEEDRPTVLAMLKQTEERGLAGPVSVRIRRPNGELRHVVLSVRSLAGSSVGGTAIDITERIELEGQALRSQKMEALGRLAGGVAHDFNNLLTVIIGSASLALEENPGATWANEILLAGEQASSVTQQLLGFSRDAVVEHEPMRLDEMVENTLRLIRRVIGENVKIRFERPRESWMILSDRGQLTQVLMNLAANARDAMPDGGCLTLSVRNLEQEPADDTHEPACFVELSVKDEGIGMTEDQKHRAFEPFFTTKAVGRGTGLGLATVFAVIHRQGGVIVLESEPGRGTEFRIRWPRMRGEPHRKPAPPEPSGRRHAQRILVVEDERAVRKVVVNTLSKAGFVVLAAASAAEGGRLIRRHLESRAPSGLPLDLLLTDVVLPDANGVELARKARAQLPTVKVLYMTGHAAKTGGALDHPVLPKPFSSRRLLAEVERVLGLAGAARGEGAQSEASTGPGDLA